MIEKWIKTETRLKQWRRFKRRRLAVISTCILILMTIMTYCAPLIANRKPLILSYQNKIYFPVLKEYHPKVFGIEDQLYIEYRDLKLSKSDWSIWPIIRWDPFESNKEVEAYPSPPSKVNWFGTDDRGRDVLTRLIYGFRYSLEYAICVWFLSFVLGIVVGGVTGYAGGKVDFFGQRFVEILSTVPQFLLLIIIISIFTPSLKWLVFISSLFGWIGISYYVRGEFLKNRKRDYVEAARSAGSGHARVLFRHILPNSMTPIITFTPFVIATNIVSLASLDYLGFGLPVPTPSWGELLNQAYKYFTIGWWLAVFPSLALFSTLVMFNLIGEAVRDAIDPKEI